VDVYAAAWTGGEHSRTLVRRCMAIIAFSFDALLRICNFEDARGDCLPTQPKCAREVREVGSWPVEPGSGASGCSCCSCAFAGDLTDVISQT